MSKKIFFCLVFLIAAAAVSLTGCGNSQEDADGIDYSAKENWAYYAPSSGDAAESADDTGVVIAFNTEDPEIDDSLIIPSGTKSLCINPLTWSTSTEPADKSLNLGACFTSYSGG